MDKQPVEKYKLTKAQLAFQKKYGQLKKVQEILRQKMFQAMAGAKNLSDLLRETEIGSQQMLQNAPQKKLNEIEGQRQ